MLEITIIYNDNNIFKELSKYDFKNILFNFIDETNQKGKRKGLLLKSYWRANLSPFIIIKNNNEIIKLLYSETEKDIIKSLNNYLNGSKS